MLWKGPYTIVAEDQHAGFVSAIQTEAQVET